MMVSTITSGTARRTFKEQGKPAMGKHGAGAKREHSDTGDET